MDVKAEIGHSQFPPLEPRALESQLPEARTFLIGHWRPTATTLLGAEYPIQQSDPKGRPLHTLLEVTGEQPKGGALPSLLQGPRCPALLIWPASPHGQGIHSRHEEDPQPTDVYLFLSIIGQARQPGALGAWVLAM